MIIRPATLQDVDGIFEYAMAGTKLYPNLRPEPDKIRKSIIEAISTRAHFCWVAEEDNVVHGVIAAITGDNVWAQRKFCNIVLWASAAPTYGAKLLREFRNWIISRRAIRVAGFAPDCDIDSRVLALAERIGFKRHGGAYLLYN